MMRRSWTGGLSEACGVDRHADQWRAMKWSRVLALGLMCSCGDATSPLGAALRRIDFLGERGTVDAVRTSDGQFILLQTMPPSPAVLVCDRHLKLIAKRAPAPLALAASGGRDALVLAIIEETDRLELWELPVTTPGRFSDLGRDAALMALGSPTLCSARGGWVWLNAPGQVVFIDGTSLRACRRGKTKLPKVHAAAVDDTTGDLVICGNEEYVEVFDLTRMATKRCIAVEGMRAGWSLRARGGRAYVATSQGVVVQITIEPGRVEERTEVWAGSGNRSVALDLSPTGEYLAACASLFTHGNTRPTVMRVFRVKDGTLTPEARAQADLPHVPNSITLIEEQRMVVLNSEPPVLAWHYETAASGR
jgi:hypothetical protein